MPDLPRPTARRGVHYFEPRTLRHPHVVGAIIVCAVCCSSYERCLLMPQHPT